MVVVVDFSEEIQDPYVDDKNKDGLAYPKYHLRLSLKARHAAEKAATATDEPRPNPNINGFSAALACYPIASQLAANLDQTSLHSLACSCRQFRANLIPYRKQLVSKTLRCENEELRLGPKLADRMAESIRTWNVFGNNGVTVGRISSGKVGRCARDLVGRCRKCGRVVCRNCTVKAPPRSALSARHRRLCRKCIKAPLWQHTHTNQDDMATWETSFTDEAFARDPCSCDQAPWICQPCGHSMRSADTTYMRGWTWRTRYSTYLGGLGTGIGEGNEGVECGRGAQCLAAKEVEKEIDCDSDELAAWRREVEKVDKDGRRWGGTSYFTQEMEGIGGVVKKKVKKRIKVGATVREHEDERESGDYLDREHEGNTRSWCGWCSRVIPSTKDLDGCESSSAIHTSDYSSSS